MTATRLSLLAGLVLLGGCDSFALTPIGERFDNGDDDTDPVWDTAELVVLSPSAGTLYDLEDETDFEAVVVDDRGTPLEFDALEWDSDIDPGFSLSGAEGSAQLEPGQHVITVSGRLPNGDRLVHAVGGVQVQSRWSGVWSGALEVAISTTFGEGIDTGCSGGITFQVDVYGETLEGFGNCSANLFGNAVNVDLNVTGDVGRDGTLAGEMGISVAGFFDIPVEFDGSLSTDGTGGGEFQGSLFVADADGSFSVTRLN